MQLMYHNRVDMESRKSFQPDSVSTGLCYKNCRRYLFSVQTRSLLLLVERFCCNVCVFFCEQFRVFSDINFIIFKFSVFYYKSVIVVQCVLRKMSEFVIDDWKLKARTVVKLYRKNKLVFLLVKDDVLHCLNVTQVPFDAELK